MSVFQYSKPAKTVHVQLHVDGERKRTNYPRKYACMTNVQWESLRIFTLNMSEGPLIGKERRIIVNEKNKLIN